MNLRDEILKELYEVNEETGHDGIREIADAILALIEDRGTCEWKEIDQQWNTSCRVKFDVKYHSWAHCPFCGGKIVEVK